MPFRFAKEHPEGPDRVRHRIRQLPTMSTHPLVNGVVFDLDHLKPPHTVYRLRPNDLASGLPLADSVHHIGYRYLVHAAGQPYMAAHVQKHTSLPSGYFVDLNIGQFVGGTAHALERLKTHSEVKFGSFEARLLRCFPLYFMAIWLKSETGESDDLIYPLPGGAPAPFEAERLYSISDFQNNIQALVQQREAAP